MDTHRLGDDFMGSSYQFLGFFHIDYATGYDLGLPDYLVSEGREDGKEETVDMYSAIDNVLDKLEKQIKKSKQKIRLKLI